MPKLDNFISLARLGLINPHLMMLAWRIRHSGRTYLSYSTLCSLAENYQNLKKKHSGPFEVAEFGVGRGGSAMLLAWLVNKYNARLVLYDVFSRIPSPSVIDGEQAKQRYETILSREDTDYYGNLPDLLEVVKADIFQVCKPALVEFIQGKYEDVLPTLTDEHQFGIIHIDCDWYESSSVVYHYLQYRLIPGAILQVDDYSGWEGSKKAFQDAKWLNQYQTHLVDGALVIDTSRTQ